MTRAASTRPEYESALDALKLIPIIGKHTIGKLTIEVGFKRWSMVDDHGNRYGGAATTGWALRYGIHKAATDWLNNTFGKAA